MGATIQQKINPPVPQPSSIVTPESTSRPAIDSNGGAEKADFRNLITNSMDEIQKEREAKANGDLSGAKTEEEFLQKLQDQTKPKNEIKNTLDKDDFMKLFVAQLQHQDPLNPDDGAEMASKLAQFNSLEQMMNVNKNLEKMADKQNTAQNLQLVNYIGNEVTIDGGRLNLQGGQHGPMEYALKSPATMARAEVRDTAGVVVYEKDLGSLDAGNHDFKWDGTNKEGKPAPNGTYTFSLTARNIDGQDVPVDIKTKATVTGVDINDKAGGIYTNFGKVGFDEVQSVGRPGFNKDNHKPAPSAPTPSPTASMMPGVAVPAGGAVKAPAKKAPTVEMLDKLKAEGKLDLTPAPGSEAPPAVTAAAPQPTPPETPAPQS